MTAGQLSDHIALDKGVINVDIATDRTSGWFPMKDFRQAIAHLQTDTVADTKIATVEFLQATDSSGTGSKVLGTKTTLTSSGGEELDGQAEIEVTDMDEANGFDHIAIKLTSDDTTVVGSAVLIRDKGRY